MTPGTRLLLALAASLFASACGVTLDAPDIALILQPDGIVYAEAAGVEKLVGGETVIRVANATPQERRVVLVHVENGISHIPSDLLEADSARDDDRILGYSRVLVPEKADYAAGAGKVTDDTSFHVYLRPGDTYVVFDKVSDDADVAGEPLVLWLRPGAQEEG